MFFEIIYRNFSLFMLQGLFLTMHFKVAMHCVCCEVSGMYCVEFFLGLSSSCMEFNKITEFISTP